MQVVRNVVFDPRMLPGGGATELAISHAISKSVNDIEGEEAPFFDSLRLEQRFHFHTLSISHYLCTRFRSLNGDIQAYLNGHMQP